MREILKVETFIDGTEGKDQGSMVIAMTNVKTGEVNYAINVPIPTPEGIAQGHLIIDGATSLEDAFDKSIPLYDDHIKKLKEIMMRQQLITPASAPQGNFPRLAKP